MKDAVTARPDHGRRERKRQRMASHLAATAFDLFETQGYEAVTMEQIAAEADVAKATLYNYFPVKEALVAHRFREEITEGMAQLAGELAAHKTFVSRMQFLLRASAAWHASKRTYLPHYIRYLNSKASYDEAKPDTRTAGSVTQNILADMFRAAQQTGEITRKVPPEKLAWSFEFLLFGALTTWLTDPRSDLAEEFLLVFELLLNGMAITQPMRPRRKKGTATNPTARRQAK